MRRASIDIGSNTILLLLVELNEKNEILKEVLNESVVTALGKNLDKNKAFCQSSLDDSFETLKNYASLLKKEKIDLESVLVTATEASRVAQNSKDFFAKVLKEIGFKVTIITGEGEAYYTALGVVSSLSTQEEMVTIMDIGGASTELMKVSLRPFKVISSISLPVGAVRAFDWNTEGVFDQKINLIITDAIKEYQTKNLIGVAGTMTALASMYLGRKDFSASAIEGMSIKASIFSDFSRDLQNTTVENLLLLFPFLGKRALVVGQGSRITQMIGEKLRVENFQVSTRGLRYGIVIAGHIDEKFLAK